MTESLDDLLAAAAGVQSILVQHGWRFCFIGGIAVQRWGNPRFTQDVDKRISRYSSGREYW